MCDGAGRKEEGCCRPAPGGVAAENPQYLNCVENGLGLREWLESSGHTFITTADKEGPNSGMCFCKELLPKNLTHVIFIISKASCASCQCSTSLFGFEHWLLTLVLPAELAKNLHDTNVIITTPFHPAYMTKDLIKEAPKLELILTAGVGSDHIDLHAAADKGITVAEVIASCPSKVY